MYYLIKIADNRISLIIMIVIIFIIILPFIVIGQGTLTDTTFFSNSLGMNRNVQIYLPEDYNSQDSLRYPTLYFLHGALGNHTSYPELVTVLNNLIGDSTISPIIVIKPNGDIGPWAGSMYTNSELYGDFEDYIVYDLVEFIDSTYKTISLRDKRVVMGHSMGGYGSMKMVLLHPDIFCGVAAHSGPLDFNQMHLWISPVLIENGGAPIPIYNPTAGPFTYLLYTATGAFSPNLNNTPYPVDFLIDNMGVIIDSVFNRWLLHDPARLVANITPSSDLAIYFDCGIQDELFFHAFNIGFADTLSSLGFHYIFQSYTGNHSNQIVNRFPIALSFLDSVLSTITHITNEYNNSLHSFMLSQNYPNPFNLSTTIEFFLDKKSIIKIEIFNLLGQKIESLVNKQMPAGTHEIEFTAKDLPSGVYFYSISAGDRSTGSPNGQAGYNFQQVKKMILLK